MDLLNHVSPCQQTFLAASIIYPLTLSLSLPPNPTPSRLAKSREAISLIHCTLMTVLSIECLRRSSISNLVAQPDPTTSNLNLAISARDLPIITTRSTFANALTTLETAYLVQDSLILIYAHNLHQRARASDLKPTKGLNITHLAYHHAALSIAFFALQWYIYRSREKGVLIIILFMLMNASSPFGTVRWYLLNFWADWRSAIRVATVGYLGVYAVCRVWLIWYVLRVFGRQRSMGALETFKNLRWQCRLGTGTMVVVNTSWLVMGVLKFIRRSLGEAGHGKRKGS